MGRFNVGIKMDMLDTWRLPRMGGAVQKGHFFFFKKSALGVLTNGYEKIKTRGIARVAPGDAGFSAL